MQSKKRVPLSSVAALLFLIALVVAVMFATFHPAAMPLRQTAAAPGAMDPFANINTDAKAVIVIDMQSGRTLYQKNADVQLPLASLTKVALVLATTEVLLLDSIITIPYYAGGAEGSEHLTKGERWRVRDVIDFTLIASSNNGAEILADAANDALHKRYPNSPADSATLSRMNDIARTLGLQHTYFLNVSGLDLSTTLAGAYGSARDVATLYAYAASAEPSLFAATARDSILLTAVNEDATRNAYNTNDAQGAIPGLIMGKTGTTDLAGGNLAVVFDVGLAHPVVAVVLGSSEEGRFADMKKLVATTRKALTETE